MHYSLTILSLDATISIIIRKVNYKANKLNSLNAVGVQKLFANTKLHSLIPGK